MRLLVTVILVTAVVPSTHVVDALDALVEPYWLHFVQLPTQDRLDPDIRLIVVDAKDNGELGAYGSETDAPRWRAYDAKLLAALSKAGATVVAFDFAYPESPKYWKENEEFATEIERVHKNTATRVVVGSEANDSCNKLDTNERLLKAVSDRFVGTIRVAGRRPGWSKSSIGRILLAELCNPNPQPSPPRGVNLGQRAKATFPLLIWLAYQERRDNQVGTLYMNLDQSTVFFDEGNSDKIVPVVFEDYDYSPVRKGKVATHFLQMVEKEEFRKPTKPYATVYSSLSDTKFMEEYKDKIVLVGAEVKGSDTDEAEWVRTARGYEVWGYQVHISIVSNLVERHYPRLMKESWNLSLIFALCLVIGGCQVIARRWETGEAISVPIGGDFKVPVPRLVFLFILLVYFPLAMWIYNTQFIVLDVTYHIQSIILTYAITKFWVIRRTKVAIGFHPTSRASFLGLLIPFGLLLLPIPVLAGQQETSPECRLAGRLDGIVIAGQPQISAAREDFAVTREGSSIGVRNGMPLCYGDVLSTGDKASAIVRLEMDTSEYTLKANSRIKLEDQGLLSFLAGELFARFYGLHRARRVNTSFGQIGLRRTQFYASLGNGGIEVIGVDGVVEFSPRTTRRVARPQLKPSIATHPESREQGVQTPPSTFRVRRLGQLSFYPAKSSGPRVEPVSDDALRAVLDQDDEVFIRTRPFMPRRNLLPYIQNPEERGAKYREARFLSIKNPMNAAALQQMGDAYADWGEGTKALQAYARIIALNKDHRSAPGFPERLCNAYRLTGDWKLAESYCNAALRSHPESARAQAFLANVARDRAHSELDASAFGVAQADLEKSVDLYEKALRSSSWGDKYDPNRLGLLYSLGEVQLLIAETAAASSQTFVEAPATTYLERARSSFRSATNPDPKQPYPYALLGNVQALVTEAELRRKQGKTEEENQKLKEALSQIEEVVKDFGRFASAHYWRGRILELRGQPVGPVEEFVRAIELDPQFADSYLAAATAFTDKAATASAEKADRLRALEYFGTYLNLSDQMFPTTLRGSVKKEIELLERQVIVPDLGGLLQEAAEQLLESVDLRRGFRRWEPSDAAPGTVKIQIPTPGEFLPVHGTVDLYLSAGRPKNGKEVPEGLIGKSGSQAKEELAKAKVGLDGQIFEAQGCESGTEVVFHWPPRGEFVESGGPVYLFVGKKHEYMVPKIVQHDFRDHVYVDEPEMKPFFLLSRQEKAEGVPPWIYYNQNPKDGAKASCGTWIIAYYWKPD